MHRGFKKSVASLQGHVQETNFPTAPSPLAWPHAVLGPRIRDFGGLKLADAVAWDVALVIELAIRHRVWVLHLAKSLNNRSRDNAAPPHVGTQRLRWCGFQHLAASCSNAFFLELVTRVLSSVPTHVLFNLLRNLVRGLVTRPIAC